MEHAPEKFALVLPTLNEVGNIQLVLDLATAAMSSLVIPWEIVVVDDDSRDGTAEAARKYSEREPRVRLASRFDKCGLAGAITYGWEHSTADLLGVMDADLQHPAELLPALVNQIFKGFDVAIASRYVHPHSMDEWNSARRMISRLSVLASKPVQRSTIRVKDPLSGFFVVRRECVEGLDFQSSGFKLLLEILARGRVRTVSELPFKFAIRQHGNSKAGPMTAVHYLSLLWRLSRDTVFRPRESNQSRG